MCNGIKKDISLEWVKCAKTTTDMPKITTTFPLQQQQQKKQHTPQQTVIKIILSKKNGTDRNWKGGRTGLSEDVSIAGDNSLFWIIASKGVWNEHETFPENAQKIFGNAQ